MSGNSPVRNNYRNIEQYALGLGDYYIVFLQKTVLRHIICINIYICIHTKFLMKLIILMECVNLYFENGNKCSNISSVLRPILLII